MNPAELVRDMHTRIEELERQIAEAQAREQAYREACQLAHDACQDNLKMYQYKNEPALMDAFHAARAALALPHDGSALERLLEQARSEESERLTKVIAEWRTIVEREHNPSCATLGGEPCDCTTGQAEELRQRARSEERAACIAVISEITQVAQVPGLGNSAAIAIRKRGSV